MTQEDKILLLKDLCARLPYGVCITWDGKYPISVTPSIYNAIWLKQDFRWKSYLRPMSSMTDGEKEVFKDFQGINIGNPVGLIDWLNEHYFDYRGLIEKGLALEAKEEMYKID